MEEPAPESPGDAPTVQPAGKPIAATPTLVRGTPADDEAAAGPKEIGPYLLLDELGHGGMGVVYRARHRNLGTLCAVKLLISGEHASDEAIARFQREAASVARMGKHPHIVHVFDLGREGGATYYAMELVEGLPLSKRLREGEFTLEEAAELVEKVSRAVQFAHDHGVIHRDLKPDNIVVRSDREPQVMDFGLARDLSAEARMSLTGDVMGTPAYMAPEQARGDVKATDARTDVYSLGGVLYEMLTGVPPHPGHSLGVILDRILQGDILPPRRLRQDVPRDLETVCLKCLSLEPDRRYPSAAELADDLARWRRGEPIRARRVTWVERGWKRLRRHALVSAVTTGLALAALVAGGAWWRSHLRAAAREEEKSAAEARARDEAGKRQQTLDKLYEKASGAVVGFEDAVMRHPMSPAVRDVLARQPLDVLEELIRQVPGFGPAYSWRGKVKELLRDAGADDDYDRGCELSPDSAIVWYLRGMSLAERYARERGLTGITATGTEARMQAAVAEAEAQRELRLRVLAAFDRMARCAVDRLVGEAERRIGLGLAALHQGTREGWDEALRHLSGLAGPRAARLEGLARMHRGDFDPAIGCFSETLSEWPEDGEAWNYRAMARATLANVEWARGVDSRERIRQAILDYEEAIARDPEHVTARTNCAVTRTLLASADSESGADAREGFRKAIEDCAAAIALRPTQAETYLARGAAFDGLARAEQLLGTDPREHFRKAIDDYGAVLGHFPVHVMARSRRGIAWWGMAEAECVRGIDPLSSYRKAIVDFDAALAQDPEQTASYINRGSVWRCIGDVEAGRGLDPKVSLGKAMSDFDEALARDAAMATAWHNRGVAWKSLGDAEASAGSDPRGSYRKALADMNEALSRAPGFALAYVDRGRVRLWLAFAEIDRGIDERPELRRAADDFGEALRRNPELGAAWNGRGTAWLKMAEAERRSGDDSTASYAAGESDFRRAIEKHEPMAYYLLGQLFRVQRRYDEAIAVLEAGLPVLPQYAEAVRQEIALARRLRSEAQEPWGAKFAEGGRATGAGDLELARKAYEDGLRLLDEALARLAAEDRAKKLEDPSLRAALVHAHYNLGCILSLASDGRDRPGADPKPVDAAEGQRLRSEAFAHLASALGFGWRDRAHLQKDADLAPLHADPRWEELLGRLHD